jgi:hypothetical protein
VSNLGYPGISSAPMSPYSQQSLLKDNKKLDQGQELENKASVMPTLALPRYKAYFLEIAD